MNNAVARGLRGAALRRGVLTPMAAAARIPRTAFRRPASSLPTIAQPSFWKSIVPKPLRQSPEGKAVGSVVKAAKQPWWSKEWNPATFYIAIFLCIGSMAIQMISLKKNYDTFMRQSEVKINLLREVVERIQRGEDVDVERVLGTGNPEQEAEWEAALKEIERNEGGGKAKKQKRTASKESKEEPKDSASEAPVKTASITNFY